jgi:hypothetical protein
VYEIEVLDGELVSHPRVQLESADAEHLPLRVAQPAVHMAVALATGFVAGAATMALLRRYGQARLESVAAAAQGPEPRARQARTFVVHVRQVG